MPLLWETFRLRLRWSKPHTRIVRSSLAEANIWRFTGFQLTQFTAPECPGRANRSFPDPLCHIYTYNKKDQTYNVNPKCLNNSSILNHFKSSKRNKHVVLVPWVAKVSLCEQASHFFAYIPTNFIHLKWAFEKMKWIRKRNWFFNDKSIV